MKMLPLVSTATPLGALSRADVASPPSPEEPGVPSPATVAITPVPAATLRMRLLARSAMYTLPLASTATPAGLFRPALAAATSSLVKPPVPLPASVAI